MIGLQVFWVVCAVLVILAKLTVPWFDANVRWWAIVLGVVLLLSVTFATIHNPQVASMYLRDVAAQQFDKSFFDAVSRKVGGDSLTVALSNYQITGPTTCRVFFSYAKDLSPEEAGMAGRQLQAYLTASVPVAAYTAGLPISRADTGADQLEGITVPSWIVEGFPKPVSCYKLLVVDLQNYFCAFIGHEPESSQREGPITRLFEGLLASCKTIIV